MLQNPVLSLAELVGGDYAAHVCAASEALGLGRYADLMALAQKPVEFFPDAYRQRLDALVPRIGTPLSASFPHSSPGAGTDAFQHAFHASAAPLSGMGFYRLGEDGRLAVIGKSEHYQASLGHNFPGYELLRIAAAIGITNITHNNTRGHITRLLERELVRIANGLERGDEGGLAAVLASREPHVLNRVINLETGSLACEAAFKMMLARFYRLQPQFPAPVHAGKTPVFLVMADRKGGPEANYHGTTILTQILRGMWSELAAQMEQHGLLKVVPVPINDAEAFAATVAQYDEGSCKVAGFLHELVLMNYGGIRLDNAYVDACHALCRDRGIPVFVDEIQSCMWSPQLFLFKEYQCHPDFVSVGKGFPGGCYPASKILTTAEMDNLNQFGALVTNGQEELASLAYLVTIRFAEANAAHTATIAADWRRHLGQLLQKHPATIRKIEGDGLLTSLFFADADHAVAFCRILGDTYGIDASAQTYKADCPPAVLMKLQLIASEALVAAVADAMDRALAQMETP